MKVKTMLASGKNDGLKEFDDRTNDFLKKHNVTDVDNVRDKILDLGDTFQILRTIFYDK